MTSPLAILMSGSLVVCGLNEQLRGNESVNVITAQFGSTDGQRSAAYRVFTLAQDILVAKNLSRRWERKGMLRSD